MNADPPAAGVCETQQLENVEAPGISPELRAQLLDADAWAGILLTYAKTLKVAAGLTDAEGRQIGNCLNPQPTWLQAQTTKEPVRHCFCLGVQEPCGGVQETLRTGKIALSRDVVGLAHVSVPLRFEGRIVGALLAGQVFDRYPETLVLRRFARDAGLSAQNLWDVAVRQTPISSSTLLIHGELLEVLGDAFIRQRYALFLAECLKDSNEQLAEANSSLQQFAYSASHDLQEPLRTIVIYGQLFQKLYEGKLDAQGEQYLEDIIDAAKSMGLLVAALLTYTLIGAEANSSAIAVDANLTLQKVLAILAVSIQEHSAVITHSLLPTVQIGEVHLQQLFQNLISNALNYSKPGEKSRIHVSAEEGDGEWIFSVSDNGIGIHPDHKNVVFGIFKSLQAKTKHSGTGIGLAICKRIVERYGGRIWVESDLGKGANFRFTLRTCLAVPGDGQETSRK